MRSFRSLTAIATVGAGLLAGTLAAPTAGAQSGVPGPVVSAQPATSNSDVVRWTQRHINVCWEDLDDSTSADRKIVRNAIANTWTAASVASWGSATAPEALVFTGWGECGTSSRGIRIAVSDVDCTTDGCSSWPRVAKFGAELDGRVGGMHLNHTFEFERTTIVKGKKVTTEPFSGCQADRWGETARRNCVASIAVHEFGHALGFHHEQEHPDTPAACLEAEDAEIPDGTIGVTPYDKSSIMNYCNTVWNNAGVLSAGDIAGLRELYGKVTDVVASAGRPRTGEVVTWYADGTYARGSRTDLDSVRTGTFTVAKGKKVADVIGIAIHTKDGKDRTVAWYSDSTYSMGSMSDLDSLQAPKAFSLPKDLVDTWGALAPRVIVDMEYLPESDTVVTWFNTLNVLQKFEGTTTKLDAKGKLSNVQLPGLTGTDVRPGAAHQAVDVIGISIPAKGVVDYYYDDVTVSRGGLTDADAGSAPTPYWQPAI